jgi:hypothetical protein
LFAAAPAGAVSWGLADQYDGPYSDSRVVGANVTLARLLVPWDVAYQSATYVDLWMRAVIALGATPLVTFERSRGDRCPETPCTLPSVDAYLDAFEAFRKRWPIVREFAAWNEPNHSWQPTAKSPVRAAAFHDALRQACSSCTIAAGSFVDSSSMKSYFRDYSAALTRPVQVWALHNYGDLTYERASYTEWLLERTTQPLWLTEAGGIVFLRSTVDGRVSLPYDEQRGVRAIGRLLQLLADHADRLERAYVYHWQAAQGDDFDSGLLSPDGTARPALKLWLDAVGPRQTVVPKSPEVIAGNEASNGDRRPDGVTVNEPQLADAARVELANAGLQPNTVLPSTERRAGDVAAPLVDTAATGTGPRIGTARRTKDGWFVPVRCAARDRRGCRGSLTLVTEVNHQPRTVGQRQLRLKSARWARVHVVRKRTVAADAPLLGVIRVLSPLRVGIRHFTTETAR